ncbi:MAG: L,D-transpeptidase [Flavobacteriales bacterium]|nr:L,D-transpeptidase [Flavobacteriales bacterium]
MLRWWLLLFMLIPGTAFLAATAQSGTHPKQGLIDLLMEYMEVRYPEWKDNGDLLYVSLARQRMFLVKDRRLEQDYPVATSSNGPGMQRDTFRTPTGLHRIQEKIGGEVPPLGILRDREFTGQLADPDFAGVDKDWITSRILWLDGLEPNVNRGGDLDSHDRFIYIHGTANERSIGTPSSRGCVRMRNSDVIDLYDRVQEGMLVVILDN